MIELRHIEFVGAEPVPLRYRPLPVPGVRGSPRPGRRPAPEPATPELPDPFVSWLLAQAGLDARSYRAGIFERRLPACLRRLKVPSEAAARELLVRDPRQIPTALDTMLIGVTGYFRDTAVFDALRDEVIPDLNRRNAPLAVYAAGVSTGEELYSVAILLAEAGILHRARLLGVDCRENALAAARQALLAAEDQTVPASWRARYFYQDADQWRVRPELRARIEWRRGDVLTFAETGWDLVLFRNVAIYLDPAQVALLWTRLCQQLKPGGFLVTGKAEKPPAHLPLARLAPCTYQKMLT